MDRGAWWATVYGGHKRVGHDWATKQQNNKNQNQPSCVQWVGSEVKVSIFI